MNASLVAIRRIVISGVLLLIASCSRSSVEIDGTAPPQAAESSSRSHPEPQATPPAQHVVRWNDVTRQSGIDFTYRNGREARHYSILETLGGGVALVDFDGDHRLDVYFPGGGRYQDRAILGRPGALFRNVDGARFENVTLPAEAAASAHYSHGCQAADYNDDGFRDLLITGFDGLQLLVNQGDGTFVDSPVRLNDRLWSTGAAWGDLNGDGWLDLYVAHYVNWSFDNDPRCPGPTPDQQDYCPPKMFEPLPDAVFWNDGQGGLLASDRREPWLRADGKGLGVLMADANLDGRTDIYVTNDTTDNFLYLNRGDGVFEEVGVLHGVSGDETGSPDGSMGVDLGDFNRDGMPDLWVTNFEAEPFALYRNEGQGLFLHVSELTGVNTLGGLFVGFGTAFLDVDGDGWEDLAAVNGHIMDFPWAASVRQLPLLLHNQRGQSFARLAFPPDTYFSTPHAGRGLAVGDVNDDGALDLAISNNEEPAALLYNATQQKNPWLRVRLIGRQSNRDAVGARLVLHTSEGDQTRLIKGGGSYLSQSDLRLFFGVPANAKVNGLTVDWPSGQTQQVKQVTVPGDLTLIEPRQ